MPWCKPVEGVDDMALLADPFNPNRVKLRPNKVDGRMATGFAYVDARVIEARLDDVCGNENWEDEYEVLAGDFVMCRLTITMRDGTRKVTKMDVGAPSDSPNVKHKLKGAFSDALKRVAVKFGIGRYLYTTVPNGRYAYDGRFFTDEAVTQFRKRLLKPRWSETTCASDKQNGAARKAAKQEPPAQQPAERPQQQGPAPQQAGRVQKPADKAPFGRPADGGELYRRLKRQEDDLYKEGRVQSDELLSAVMLHMGREKNVYSPMDKWEFQAVQFAYDWAVEWVKNVPPPAKAREGSN